MSKSVNLFSNKYNDFLKQSRTTNAKVDRHGTDISKMKQDVNLINKRACDALGEIDDLAQYVRRVCLEISGIEPSENCKAEDIVKSVGEAMGTHLHESDFSIAHPLPTLNRSLLNSHIES